MTPPDPPGQLWAGRFSEPPAPEAHELGRSLGFDVRLASHDIDAGIAHVRALEDTGWLSSSEADTLATELLDIGLEIAEGRFDFDTDDEDVHSAIERALIERLGAPGARLHAGRSRNDLVVTDLRLWLLASERQIRGLAIQLGDALIAHARDHAATVMPGTTHGRPAQPVTLGHHLLAHVWPLNRDLERFDDWAERASTSALGAGAVATNTLGLDPSATASRLGMRRAFTNSIDAVSDRDFVLEFLADASILATHLSRLAADLARWTDPSLGWAEMHESFSTGSSMMPQKRNPDTAELVRAKAPRVAASFQTLAAVLDGLPLGYHRDLQEDKQPSFDAVDTLELVLPALTGAVRTIRFDIEAMRSACSDDGLYATDLAEGLVRSGVPFREAHGRTGELLKDLAAQGRTLHDLTSADWETFGVPDGARLLDPDAAVEARGGLGGPSRASVLAQADDLQRALDRAGTERSRSAVPGRDDSR